MAPDGDDELDEAHQAFGPPTDAADLSLYERAVREARSMRDGDRLRSDAVARLQRIAEGGPPAWFADAIALTEAQRVLADDTEERAQHELALDLLHEAQARASGSLS